MIFLSSFSQKKEIRMPAGARGVKYAVRTWVLSPGKNTCGITGKSIEVPDPASYPEGTFRCPSCNAPMFTNSGGGDRWQTYWHPGCQAGGGVGDE